MYSHTWIKNAWSIYGRSTPTFLPHGRIMEGTKHKTTIEAAWIDNCKTMQWVQGVVERKAFRTSGEGSFHSGNHVYGTGRGGNSICKRLPLLSEVKKTHARMMEDGNFRLFDKNTVMDMYVKCGSMVDARHMFDNMLTRNVVSWNVMILGYAKQEEGWLALELYAWMHKQGVQPSDRTFVGALKACSTLAALEEGKQANGHFGKTGCLQKGRAIHSQIIEIGFDSNVYVGTTLVDMYAKCGAMVDARHIFDNLPQRDVVTWTAMVLGYAQMEEGVLALELYARMFQEGATPDQRTIVGALKACISLAALEEGRQVEGKLLKIECLEKGKAIHTQSVENRFETDVFVGTNLVDMYSKCGSMDDAWHVFDLLPQRDVVSWTAMISGYAQKEEGALALELYAQMHKEGAVPDHRTFVAALKACSSLAGLEDVMEADGKFVKIGCLEKGRAIHSEAVKKGFESNVFVGTTLVDWYAKCGSMEDARHVFYELPHHDVVSWTAMILGYAQKNEGLMALELYTQMQQEGILPDDRVFVGGLKACSSMAALEEGKRVDGKLVKLKCLEKCRAIHAQSVKADFDSDVFVGTTLVDMYVKCGSMEDAEHVFDKSHHDAISWAAMISGYAEQEESEEALKLYEQMQAQGLPANNITFVGVLKACGNIAAVETGMELHCQVCKLGLETTAVVANSLIDMYAKSGSMVDAQKLFDALPERDFVTWNVFIAGYARQGNSEYVFKLFERMKQEGVQPNGVTFLSVLTVCSHVGHVDRGQKYFQSMINHYHISPSIEHYTCMVDLLGRAGHVEDALAMVERMPFQPDIVTWVSLLAACRKWKNVDVGRHAFEHAVRIDKRIAAPYVLMSNIYAHSHRWEDVNKIQAMRTNSQAWKKPGRSWWTGNNGMVHTFVAGDRKHPQSKDIYAKLDDLYVKMNKEGHIPNLECVLQNISADEKEGALCGHSEKLAVACALINTPKGTPIRIVKNLRICVDCHKVIALISKIEYRTIICRDSTRFHNFMDGKCSCGGYW